MGKGLVRKHVFKYHAGNACGLSLADYCPSGSKQRKVMMALFDQDMMARHDPQNLLRRSADFVGTMLGDSVSGTKNYINKDIALCITGRGP